MSIDLVIATKILEILSPIASIYAGRKEYEDMKKLVDGNERRLADHLLYLEGHDLIMPKSVAPDVSTPAISIAMLRITSRGQDFLMKDGGLSTIKNTVTVKFHKDSVALIVAAIEKSNIPQQEKSSLVAKVKELPLAAIEHLLKRILDLGLEHLPDVSRLI